MRLKQCIFALVAMLLCAFSATAQGGSVAKIGNTEYTTFADAMAAANAATGNVDVEVYGAVEFIDGMELNGSYSTITFTRKSAEAKITINQTAGGDYLTAHGKTVAFNDLILAKANPAWSGNSGHMGNYFSIQGGTVAYTDCTFPNGACTSGGTATYDNCTFQNTSEYGLWVYDDALVTVNGGTIDSKKGIKVYSEDEQSVTSTLTVKNATFTANVSAKPAVAVGYAESITLIGNTYNNTTAHVELDSGSDADCEGITFVAQDSEGNDIASTLEMTDRSNSSAPCGVLVDGKIYTTVTEAAAEATEGSTVTLLYDSTEEVELPEGVTLDKNGYTADNVTVATSGVAKIGSTTYATFAEALTAASAMSGDVTVEVYDKVTLNTAFSGSYSSINFVGKDTDAEIYLDVQGYITATGKKVSFTDLTLSKSAGGYMNNAGFMNVAFGIYDVTEVAYTNCVFANGAYASSGNVTFNECTFYRSHDKYGLWAYGNVDATVEGCTFADYRGIKMYAEGAAKTVDLTVKNTDFSAVTDKPAIVLTYGESVVLEGNTYSSTGTFELDLDGAPNGTAVTSDVAPTCKNDNGTCGVLVDGKIYTTVAQAAEVAAEGSNVTLLYSTNDAVEFAEGVNLTLADGVTADNVTVATSGVAKIGETTYATLEDAFKAATSGCTIDILSDVTVDYAWDARYTGAKFTVPVTINGNDHTLKFTNLVYDGGNHFAAFRFEDDATVNNLTVDMTEAQSGFQGRFRAISSKANLTVNGCTFIGNGSANNTRAIIFGEGAGSNAANLAISVTDSNFEGWKRGISDNENAQDVKSVTVTGNTLKDAAVYVSANETVTFTGNTVEGAYVNIKSYTTGNTLNVTATGNTLEANTGDVCNSIQAGGTVDAQGEFVVPAKGSNSFAYTKEENGYVRVWGEGGGNAKESYELKLYSGETLIATTKLNNVGNILNGDVYVTWNFYYPQSTDEYWTTTWEEGHPNSAAQPTEVELYIDGTLVATTAAKMSGADDIAPVVWRNLGGVAIANLLGEGTETSPYLISNKKELLWFQAKVDEQAADGSTQFAGKYFKLTADIDLADENWNPIGSMIGDHGSFKGVFDGGDHTISNLKVEQAGNGIGLFARTAGNAVIKNLKLKNVSVKSTDNSNYAGAVVGNAYASTKIENVHVSGNVLVSGRGYIGGIAGHGYVVMDNVSVVATGDGQGNDKGLITSTFWCAGGILGYGGEGTTNIMNANVENVVVTSAAGGLGAIVGMAEDNEGTQPISGSNLSAKDVEIKTYIGAYGDAYANYALGYLYGGNPTSKLTGENSVENVTIATSNGVAPTPVDAVAKINDAIYFSLQAALDAAAAGTGNVTVEILADVNLTGIDWNPVTVSGPGYPLVTVEGNDNTITGLNDMLFGGTWAGGSGLIIKDLTIANSAIVNDKEDAAGTVGVGAFIGYPQASATITLENCHLMNSSVEGGHWTGGLIGMAGGYNGEDGPVFMNLTIKGCSVTGSTITGKGSVGGVIGHGSCSAWTNVVIEETTVEGNTITSTGSSTNKAGAVMGTIGAAGQPATANGETKTGGASVSATVAGNNVTSNTTVITTIYGRQGTNTGMLYVAGGSYDNYPIEQGVAYAAPIEGYEIVENADGTYGIQEASLAGEGTEANPYLISSVDDLVLFRNSVNAGETKYSAPGIYVALGADIDLAGENWIGIGSMTADHGFMGNFDGKNFKIKNLTIDNPALDSDGYAYAGLFALTEGTDKDNQNFVKNLTIENVTINTTGHIASAAIAYAYYTVVDNVTVCGNIAINGGDYTAGVLAYTRRCVNASNLSVVGNSGSYVKGNQVVGGVISDIQMNGGLTAVYNNFSAEGITVSGKMRVGGISGIISTQTLNGATVKNVTLNSEDKFAGVVAGCLGGTSTITNVVAENVTGATALIGATYDDPKAIQAKIGDTYYATLQTAATAAKENETVTLIADVEATEALNINCALDLNGHSLTATVAPTALPEGYAALPNLDGKFVIGAQPTATVNNLGMTTVAAGDYSIWNGSFDQNTEDDGDMPLSFVMQFLADQDAEDMATSPFADWYGDFVITFTGIENGSFTADGCYLAGHYGSFGWVKVPVDGMTIEEGARYPVMLGVGLGQKYDYICSSVEDFKCALYLTPEILEANPNIQVKLELGVVDNSQGSDAAASALINNENVYSVTEYTYDAEDFVVDPNYIAELTIDDAEGANYTNDTEKTVGTLTYKRTLVNGKWNALYLPFKIELTDELLANYDFADYNQMISSDTNGDRVPDSFEMELFIYTGGTLDANYPYFVRPKNEEACSMNLVLTDATLYPANENSLVTSSVKNTFKLSGTYSAMDEAALAGKYAISIDGDWSYTVALKPYRLYLTITDNNGAVVASGASKSVRIVVRGEDGTTEIEGVYENPTEDMIFDLQGRRVLEPQKGGMYIINGKKVIF